MQVQSVQNPQSYMTPAQPNYNAVKIDINNPQVNAPTPGSVQAQSQNQNQAQSAVTSPIYNSIPTASVYEVPKQSLYDPKQNFNQPPAVKEAPTVPPPVIIPPSVLNMPSAVAAAKPADSTPAAPTVSAKEPVQATPDAKPVQPVEAVKQTVDVKAPEEVKPQVDVNEFIAKLTSPDYEVQANAMESIANIAQNTPQKAGELLDVKVVDALLNIMKADTSKLTGPTPQQLQIREKIMSGKSVNDSEKAEANKISPMEQAERNKMYSIYTVAMLQKLYGSEVEKLNNSTVPMTELPGAAGIVEQIKNNKNPMVRAAGIEALSYIQRPEYKQDLTTLFSVAQKDKDTNVQKAATKALEKLSQVADPQPAQAAQQAQPATAEQKPADKKAV